ncbi:hypothetical protein E2C01_034970 [Portunus trituberculatus]|uniref:Uncharacterized protein n=1 Tax=Portunus trituberculatus TaxID=210409 RepID=A0A5B7F2Y3_PORTR|nr:hypothetical protein [Portunus trituberculatus]
MTHDSRPTINDPRPTAHRRCLVSRDSRKGGGKLRSSVLLASMCCEKCTALRVLYENEMKICQVAAITQTSTITITLHHYQNTYVRMCPTKARPIRCSASQYNLYLLVYKTDTVRLLSCRRSAAI